MTAAGGPTPPARERFDGIQVGRAVAAILVVMTHASSIVAQPRFYGAHPLDGRLLPFGVGVDFFFVLSGFIIAWVHGGDLGRPDRLRRFAVARFVRIYPAYWLLLIPLALLYQVVPGSGLDSQRDPWNVLASLLLVPYPAAPVIGVAWTLVYEMIFYGAFGLVILLPRRAATPILAGWALLVCAAQVGFDRLPFPLTILLNAHILQFLLGVACAAWLRRRRIPAPLPVAIGAALVFFAAMIGSRTIVESHLLSRLVFGLSSGLFIVGIVQYERVRRLRVPSWMLLLGAASYAIYLIHGVAQSATIQILDRLAPDLDPIWATVILVVASVLVGTAYHVAVETPLNAWLRARLMPARPGPPAHSAERRAA